MAGVAVTGLALGTAALAISSPSEAVATVVAAYRAGITVVDTSPWYGRGAAEERLGQAIRELPPGALTISTKVGYVISSSRRAQDFGAEATRRSLADSLTRLGVSTIDTVLIHDPDDHLPEALDGAYPTLCRLRDEGVIRRIGVGMNQVEGLARFVREVDLDLALVAGRYTLLDRSAGEELLPLCQERGVEVMVGGVFNSGVLASPADGALYDYAPASPAVLAQARGLRDRCASFGVPLAAAALQFPGRHPAVGRVLMGPANRDQLAENLRHWHEPIPDELWALL